MWKYIYYWNINNQGGLNVQWVFRVPVPLRVLGSKGCTPVRFPASTICMSLLTSSAIDELRHIAAATLFTNQFHIYFQTVDRMLQLTHPPAICGWGRAGESILSEQTSILQITSQKIWPLYTILVRETRKIFIFHLFIQCFVVLAHMRKKNDILWTDFL